MFTIAVDVMGGDLGPRVAFGACKKALQAQHDLHLIITITHELLYEAEQYFFSVADRVTLVACDSAVCMSDKPSVVLRQAQHSTMSAALRAVKDNQAQAVLSAGNTGALMTLARHQLGMLPHIDRPALATFLPTQQQPVLMLDLGASVAAYAEQLVQFACLGWIWSYLEGNSRPRISLLNVGKEAIKGTDNVREADRQLRYLLEDDYLGYCEGDELYSGNLDVIVTDGFTGNAVLKSSEGLVRWLLAQLQTELSRHPICRWLAPLWKAPINALVKRISPEAHSGALLLGLNGLVIKTHGASDEKAFLAALEYSIKQARTLNLQAWHEQLDRLYEKHLLCLDE